MANKTTVISLTSSKADIGPWSVGHASDEPRMEAARLADLFERVACGLEPGTITVRPQCTASATASATATCASCVSTDKVTINGVDFAAVAYNASTSGNQWKVGNGAGANTTSATNLAAAINASTTAKIAGYVTASASGAVVTISAFTSGLLGNLTTLTSAGGTITVTGSGFLTGGAGHDVASVSYDLG